MTATAREADPADLPFVTEVLGAEQLLAKRQVRTVPEALSEVSGAARVSTSRDGAS